MASNKQELIQLHQLLAEIRVHAKNEFGLSTGTEDLQEYNEIGITSLDLNAEIDKQLNSVLALANGLTDTFTDRKPPSEQHPTPEFGSSGPSVKTKQYTLTEEAVEATDVEVSADAETPSEPVSAATDNGVRVVDGYENTESEPVQLCETSLLDNWGDVKQREDRKPIETWGNPDRTVETVTEQPVPEIGTENSVNEQEALVHDVEPAPDQKDNVAEAEQPGEQVELPTP